MKPLFALHEIHMTAEPGVAGTRDTPAKPPKEIVVKVGEAFHALSEEDHEFFLKNGAARLATESEARDLEPPKTKKVAEKKAATDKPTDTKKAATDKPTDTKKAAAQGTDAGAGADTTVGGDGDVQSLV